MKQPTLREILESHCSSCWGDNCYYEETGDNVYVDICCYHQADQTEQAIKDLLLSKLPEGRPTPDTTSDYINGFQTGYDSAKAEFIKTIEGL